MANDLQTVELGALIQLHDSEFDRQIATAKKWPRSVGRAESAILAAATASEDVAAECNYTLKRGSTKIQGPSVRFAEICASAWGNARYASRIIDEGRQFVTAQAVFMDLEQNSMISVEVQRRIENSDGVRYGVDMIGVTAQAAMSIALRNAILKGIPKSVWGDAYAKARALIAGKVETLDARVKTALGVFSAMGATEEMVLRLIDREHRKDIVPDDMVLLRGILTSLRDGEARFREVFSEEGQPAKKPDLSGAVRRGREAEQERQNAQGGRGQQHEGDAPRGEAVSEGRPDERAGADTAAEGDGGGPAGDGPVAGAAGQPASGDGKADPAGTKPALIESPKLDALAAELLGSDRFSDGDAAKLTKLVDGLRLAKDAPAINKLWDNLAIEFVHADEMLDRAQSELRTARRKDISAAAAAARGSAGTSKL